MTTAVPVTAATFATRCAEVIAKVTPVTGPTNAPEFTAGELTLSCVDTTVTAALPRVAAPVATLLNVHTLAVASHAVVVVVRTNCVVPAKATVAVSPVPPVQETVGVEVRKKLVGKLMVI